MKAFTFKVTVAAEALDTEVLVATLQEACVDALPADTLVHAKADGVKNYSEQGYKVFRARVHGITAKQAGDAHNAKAEA